jgi:hypothetical protein
MHALPLPFGFALALIPRRELDRIRRRDVVRLAIRDAATRRDLFPDDIRYYRV